MPPFVASSISISRHFSRHAESNGNETTTDENRIGVFFTRRILISVDRVRPRKQICFLKTFLSPLWFFLFRFCTTHFISSDLIEKCLALHRRLARFNCRALDAMFGELKHFFASFHCHLTTFFCTLASEKLWKKSHFNSSAESGKLSIGCFAPVFFR